MLIGFTRGTLEGQQGHEPQVRDGFTSGGCRHFPPSSLARVSVASGSVRGPHEARNHSAAPIRMLCQYKPWLEGMLYCLLQCLTSRVIPGDRRFLFGRWAGLEGCPLVGLVGMKLVHLQPEPSLVQCVLCFSWRTKMHGLMWWKCAGSS